MLKNFFLILPLMLLTSCGGDGAEFERWVAIYNGRGPGVNYKLGIAFASHPEGGWVSNNQSPLISAPEGYDQIMKPSAAKVGNQYYMYAQAMNFYGINATDRPDIFLYKSVDGENWKLHSENPIFKGASRPAFFYEPSDSGNEFKLWYRAHGATDISFASSSDGINWKQWGVVLTNGPAGTFDSINASPGVVIKRNGVYHLFYEACDDEFYFTAGEASFLDPRGVYTKNSRNPVLRRESSASSGLAIDASPGDYLISVENANVFSVGQPLVLFDNAARWELIRPVEIIDGRTIKLSTPIQQRYDVASNATLRSWAYGKVYISHIEFKNDYWYAYATAFDPYKGIASGPLEMTGFASGRDLNSLEWDYARSPLFPIISSNDKAWNGYARENPTIFKLRP